jgi:hypothetical protein
MPLYQLKSSLNSDYLYAGGQRNAFHKDKPMPKRQVGRARTELGGAPSYDFPSGPFPLALPPKPVSARYKKNISHMA